MPKTQLTVTHEGQTFTRTTERTYSHVIIGRRDIERRVAAARRDAAEVITYNWAYTNKIADGTTGHTHSEEGVARAKRMIADGLEATIAQRADECEAWERDRHAQSGTWVALSWAGRPDLAQKQVDLFRNPVYCMAEVLMVPTDA